MALRDPDAKPSGPPADIFLLLVSADSIRSEYCWAVEMKEAIKRHRQGKVRVVPVIVRPCVWQKPPLDTLYALPRVGMTVADRAWRNQDAAWQNVTEGIERLAEAIRKGR